METSTGLNRIHPLMAAAAVSVIIVSMAGAAAITGILPSSHSAPEPASLQPAAPALGYAAPASSAAPVGMSSADRMMGASSDAQPVRVAQTEAPVARPVHHTHPVQHHYTQVARNDGPDYVQRPAPQAAPRQPNYVGIGAGALIGGILGNQVGGGNGRKLATVAGVIGGGMLGNEIANRQQQ